MAASATPAPEAAARRAAALTRAASSSFYWAMRLMPPRKRAAMFAIYAFCRVVDDIADDESASRAERLAALDGWEERINALFDGAADHWIMAALAPAVDHFDLRREDFLAVIAGMRTDANGPLIAPPMQALDTYCDQVASAVGRLSVRVFGEDGELGVKVAHHQGRALQLANILRDVDEDARLGRLYLPREMLEKQRISWDDPRAVMSQPGFPALWRELAGLAAGHFEKTRELFGQCSADMRPARVMMEIYERNFTRMRALSDRELCDPSVSKRLIGKGEKLRAALKIWVMGK